MIYSLRRKLKKQEEQTENGIVAEEIKDEPQVPAAIENKKEEIVEEVSQSDIIVEEE